MADAISDGYACWVVGSAIQGWCGCGLSAVGHLLLFVSAAGSHTQATKPSPAHEHLTLYVLLVVLVSRKRGAATGMWGEPQRLCH